MKTSNDAAFEITKLGKDTLVKLKGRPTSNITPPNNLFIIEEYYQKRINTLETVCIIGTIVVSWLVAALIFLIVT